MSLVSRTIVAATAGIALVGLAACGSGTSGGSTPPTSQAASGLVNFDPCKAMTPQQLSANGLPAQGKLQTTLSFEPGCQFQNSDVTVTFYKNQMQTVDSYQKNGNWDDYKKITVNGRPAAQAQGAGSKGNGVCEVLMDSGGGVVIAKETSSYPDDKVCADALKYAQQIEPNLPK